jgi:hypothetical protein
MSRIKRGNIIIGIESLLLQLKIQAHVGAKYNTDTRKQRKQRKIHQTVNGKKNNKTRNN